MAVKLSSDLVADVMRNADPALRSKAVAKLDSLRVPGGKAFTEALRQNAPAENASAASPEHFGSTDPAANVARQGKAGAYEGFERLVLRNLFETLLPDEKSGAFGGGPSAGIWRSLAADQLAGVYADSGGVGIARMLNPSAAEVTPKREAQWPYFSLSSIKTFSS